MTKYRIDISAVKLAKVLGLQTKGDISLAGDVGWIPIEYIRGARLTALAAVAKWIEVCVCEGYHPRTRSVLPLEGTAINIVWDRDSEGISILTNELDAAGLLKLRMRLVRAMWSAGTHLPCSLEPGPSLRDIEAIAI